ncbi:MAG TPA: helix-turn-helix transcriptional regulator [Longimicrobiales bacterium]
MTDTMNGLAGDRDARLRLILGIALASIVIGGTVDLVLDRPERWLSFHVVFETLMIAGAMLLATTLWIGWWRAEKSLGQMKLRLEERKAERDRWQENARQALEGLGRVIDAQLRDWQLTAAEREVALLLLKGYSHKHVARVTGRSERTARQHAAAVYRKAGLANRNELAAWFLEDLMLPPEARIGPDSAATPGTTRTGSDASLATPDTTAPPG